MTGAAAGLGLAAAAQEAARRAQEAMANRSTIAAPRAGSATAATAGVAARVGTAAALPTLALGAHASRRAVNGTNALNRHIRNGTITPEQAREILGRLEGLPVTATGARWKPRLWPLQLVEPYEFDDYCYPNAAGSRVRQEILILLAGEETLHVGPFAGEGVPTVTREREAEIPTAERDEINRRGDERGCHTCGAKISGWPDGHWTPDHQPPIAIANGEVMQLYPHCKRCSHRQGGQVLQKLRQMGVHP